MRSPSGTKNSYWMITAVWDRTYRKAKNEIVVAMRDAGVDVRPFFHPLSSLPAYAAAPSSSCASERNPVSYDIGIKGGKHPSGLQCYCGSCPGRSSRTYGCTSGVGEHPMKPQDVKPYDVDLSARLVDRLPLVSVGLPTYNRASSLRRAIQSVLSQDYPHIELIVSDNASTDLTESICEEFSAQDKRVRYLRQVVNRGANANFQLVLSEARGTFFMWLSDDDWLDSQYLSRCVQILLEREDTVLVCGAATYVGRDGDEITGVVVNLEQDSAADRVYKYYCQVNDNGTFYGVTRRSLLLRYPMQDVLGGDWLLMGTLAMCGKIKTLEDVHIHRAIDGASADVRALAKRHGFSERAAREPHLTIALYVVKNIGWRSQVFAELGFLRRIILGMRCALIVRKRFVQSTGSLGNWPTRIRARAVRVLRST